MIVIIILYIIESVEESAEPPKDIGSIVIRGNSISQFELVGIGGGGLAANR